MSLEYNVEFFEGEDVLITDTLIDVLEDITAGSPWTFEMSITLEATPDVIELVVINAAFTVIVAGDATTDPVVTVPLTDDQTSDGTLGALAGVDTVYLWDIKRMNSGAEAILTHGTMTVKVAKTK